MALNYPYDASGIASTNKIIDELHSVQPPANIDHASFIVPRAAPFFTDSIEIYTARNRGGTKLVKNVDYFLTHKFHAGSMQLGKQVYGGIAFTNQNYTGNVYLTYQTLGGEFTVDDVSIVESITNKMYQDVRFVTWDQIQGVPSSFPPDAHHHVVTDIKTVTDLNTPLEKIAAALLAQAGGGTGGDGAMALIVNHLQAISGAHTPAAVGLGNVPNFPTATEAEALGLRQDRLMTPPIVAYLINRYIGNENLSELRDTVTTLRYDLDNVVRLAENIRADINSQSEVIDSLGIKLDNYRTELSAMQQAIIELENQVMIAGAMSNLANATAAAVDANMRDLALRVDNVIYSGGAMYSSGTHEIIIPIGTNIQVTLVGAGGGSGRYYQIEADWTKFGGGLTAGEDSILYYCGDRRNPLEPIPLLIAQGGGAGSNGYSSIGAVPGGIGGSAYRFRSERIKLSEIGLPNLATDLVVGPADTAGIAGKGGDTSNIMDTVIGVGGHYINEADDKYRAIYGRGRGGNTRGGLGGSGAKWTISVENDTGKDVRFLLKVGAAGRSSRSNVTEANVAYPSTIGSDGAGVIVIVQ